MVKSLPPTGEGETLTIFNGQSNENQLEKNILKNATDPVPLQSYVYYVPIQGVHQVWEFMEFMEKSKNLHAA